MCIASNPVVVNLLQQALMRKFIALSGQTLIGNMRGYYLLAQLHVFDSNIDKYVI